jgi:hypothetical protein
VLEHLLLTLHTNRYGPEAVLYHTGTRYVVIPYTVTESSVQLLQPMEVADSPLNTATFPMAVERLNGLASNMPGDPSSAPDIILLADRSKQLTYANKQEWRVIEGLKADNHRHFHSDHGHLRERFRLPSPRDDLSGLACRYHPDNLRCPWIAGVVRGRHSCTPLKSARTFPQNFH